MLKLLPKDTRSIGPEIKCLFFKDEEEATKIYRLLCLKYSYAKIILVVPLLSICTALFFLLFLFWYPSLRKKFFYSECNLNEATHLYIEGSGKVYDGSLI